MFASLCIKKRLTSRCLSLTSVSRSCMVPSFVFAVRQPDWLEPDITALQNLKSQFQETRSKYDNASFSDYFRHKIGYSSNKIEGNTLTESEVSTVLRGVSVGDKPMQDLLDVYYHDNAMKAIFTKVTTEGSITVELIKNIHAICFPCVTQVDLHSSRKRANFKTESNAVIAADPRTGVVYQQLFIAPQHVQEEVEKLVAWVAEHEHKMEVISFLTLFQYNLVRIHPFADGNGRVARLLTGLLCMRSGLPPLVIKAEVREQYIAALTYAHKYLDLEPLLEVMSVSLIETLEDYLDAHPSEHV